MQPPPPVETTPCPVSKAPLLDTLSIRGWVPSRTREPDPGRLHFERAWGSEHTHPLDSGIHFLRVQTFLALCAAAWEEGSITEKTHSWTSSNPPIDPPSGHQPKKKSCSPRWTTLPKVNAQKCLSRLFSSKQNTLRHCETPQRNGARPGGGRRTGAQEPQQWAQHSHERHGGCKWGRNCKIFPKLSTSCSRCLAPKKKGLPGKSGGWSVPCVV